MNYKEALEILEIDSSIKCEKLTEDYLKSKYRKMALKHHPDKNGNTRESNEKFTSINEAYHFLKRECMPIDDEIDNLDYTSMLNVFIKTMFDNNDVVIKVINSIIENSKNISLKIFEDLDKDIIFKIYSFLSKNKHTLHLKDELLLKIREILTKKYDNVQIVKLNPSIDDMLDNNVYKLYLYDMLFLVPLWCGQMYYDVSGIEIITICEPDLPDNISIDDDNNLYVNVEIQSSNLINMINNNSELTVNVGKKHFSISLDKLYIKKEQYYKIYKKGISKIKREIFNIHEKSDITIKITIV
jgi:hypothetical protein